MYKLFSFKIMSQPGKNLIYPKQFSNIFKVCNKKNNKKIKPHSNHEKRKKKGRKEYNN